MSKRDKYQVSLKVFLKNEKGELLAGKGKVGGTYEGYYDFPGGRIDEDEFRVSFDEIISRELLEELGNIKFNLKKRPVALGRHSISVEENGKEIRILYVFFEADYLGGEIKTSDEHEGHDWVDIKKVDLKKYFKSGTLQGVEMYLSLPEETST